MNLITIIGPTASGKTALAARLAYELDTEIISADSRQVYRGMDIGTGKDISEYNVNGKHISYHLIDIRDAGEKYNVFEFQQDFHTAFSVLKTTNKTPILCGGTGMYVEAVLKGYKLIEVPENKALRAELQPKSQEELNSILKNLVAVHNTSDLDSAKRTIRAIEIATFTKHNPASFQEYPPIKSSIFCIDINRDLRREKISKRLKSRLNEGMIEEVKQLLDNGIAVEDLIYYGLEYKFVTLYITKQLSFNEMFSQLEIAIHQFAKRQMTWFRGMEKRGFHVNYIDYELSMEAKIERILNENTAN